MKNNQYYYAVTRVHSNETDLLTEQSVERMRQADSLAECVNILREHGWMAEEGMRASEIVEARGKKLWAFLEELEASSGFLNLFRYEHDFANIKAAIRLRYTGRTQEFGGMYYSDRGTLSVQALKDSDASGSFDHLPELFAGHADEANRVLLQTGNAQLSDAVLDRACLGAMRAEADKRDSAVLKRYVEMRADIANVKTAIRGLKMGKTGDFFSLALTELGSLSKAELCLAASKDADAVCAYLAVTKHAACLDALKGSLSFFEAEMESRFIESLKPQKYAIGGLDPIFAFVIAGENEIGVVRLLLSSKINRFPKEFVSGCLRRMYA